jgi:hypothetical protein
MQLANLIAFPGKLVGVVSVTIAWRLPYTPPVASNSSPRFSEPQAQIGKENELVLHVNFSIPSTTVRRQVGQTGSLLMNSSSLIIPIISSTLFPAITIDPAELKSLPARALSEAGQSSLL